MAQKILNNGDSNLLIRTNINSNFEELFAARDDLPWCSGVFQNRSIAVNSGGDLVPIYGAGDPSMIVNNRLTAPSDGVYALWCGGGVVATGSGSSGIFSYIFPSEVLNNERTSDSINNSVILPSSTIIFKRKAGQYFTNNIWTSVAITTIESSGYKRSFFFIQLSKGG